MNDSILLLKKKFTEIKKKGYVETSRPGPTGVGKTFEDLLGKKEDRSFEPDFHGIEIKTKQVYSIHNTTLFNLTPLGEEEFEIKRIVREYGYPDKILPRNKVFLATIYGNCPSVVSSRYFMRLKVDYLTKKIRLVVINFDMQLLDDSVYWNFEEIEERLYKKLKYLAIINASKKRENGKDYYHYKSIDFYKLKDFATFLKLIEIGIICVEFHIGVFREGKRKGEIHDRGTSFRIKESNITYLFDKI